MCLLEELLNYSIVLKLSPADEQHEQPRSAVNMLAKLTERLLSIGSLSFELDDTRIG